MNPFIGWALAAAAIAAGWWIEGLRGLALGVTLVVFWLVLQFNRSLRVLRRAGESPIGHVDSAVMLNAKLRAGMQMMEVLALTKSLGRRCGSGEDVWAWADPGQIEVVVTFRNGRCTQWVLRRPPEPAQPSVAAPADRGGERRALPAGHVGAGGSTGDAAE